MGDGRRLVGKGGGHARRHDGEVEDPVDVRVLGHRERPELTGQAAGGDDAQLEVQRQERFENAGHPPELGERRRHPRDGVHAALALAVVAEAGGLEDRRQPDRGHRSGQVGVRCDRGVRPDSQPDPLDERFLGRPVLGDGDCVRAGRHDSAGGESLECGRRRVLELCRHHCAAGGHFVEGAGVVVRRDEVLVDDVAHGCVGIRVEGDDLVPHRPCGDGQHPPELAATEDADRRRRENRPGRPSRPGRPDGPGHGGGSVIAATCSRKEAR